LATVASDWSSPFTRPLRRREDYSCVGPGALTTSRSSLQEPAAADVDVLRCRYTALEFRTWWLGAGRRSSIPSVSSSVGGLPCSAWPRRCREVSNSAISQGEVDEDVSGPACLDSRGSGCQNQSTGEVLAGVVRGRERGAAANKLSSDAGRVSGGVFFQQRARP
jgi:hypothetical protein